jgi:hypothetical protein
MTIEADIRGVLTSSTGLAALSSNRVYSAMIPEDAALPYLYFDRIETVRFPCMGADSRLKGARFAIGCWAEYSSDARNLSLKASSALDRYASSTGTVTIQRVFLGNQQDEPELDPDEDIFCASLEVTAYFST